MKYTVVIENSGTNYSAYVPDLPGCIATGRTIEEAENEGLPQIERAIRLLFQLQHSQNGQIVIHLLSHPLALGRFGGDVNAGFKVSFK